VVGRSPSGTTGSSPAVRAARLPAADVEPRATGHVPDMLALIRAADSEGGHAYATGGDVYFDVDSFPDYGTLSRQPSPGQLPP